MATNSRAKDDGKAMKGAAKRSTKAGQKITRDTTTDRDEIRKVTANTQGRNK